MVARKTPPPIRFNVLVDGKPVEVSGYESTPALGIASDGPRTYASVMLMSGVVLEKKFASIDEAHAFNVAVAAEKKLQPGTSNLLDFYARGGGLAATKLLLQRIRKRVTK